VFCEEPPKSAITLELIHHPAVIVTPHLGASTNEAQQRVAVEIAEQFVALAANCSADARARYAVTGVVNAPVLAAAMVQTNAPWISLAKELGKMIAKMIKGAVPGTNICIKTNGKHTCSLILGLFNDSFSTATVMQYWIISEQ
jgi:D-3-phosphoglycerate dehydrogenase